MKRIVVKAIKIKHMAKGVLDSIYIVRKIRFLFPL